MRLSSLHVYPIKGCRGLSVPSAEVGDRGLAHDRRFMIVDAEGRFVTQRERAKLALVDTAIEGERLRVSASGHGAFEVPLEGIDGARTPATVWGSTVEVPSAGAEASAFFSELLGLPCTLVYMPGDVRRPVSEAYGMPDKLVSFADAFPFLLATDASLADLNARLPSPVPMDRFRPNLVVSGSAPWAEDAWTDLRIGAIAFRSLKPCDRCVVTTIDQQTAARGVEPLRTLATFRRVASTVLFAVNLVAVDRGALQVGDEVTIYS